MDTNKELLIEAHRARWQTFWIWLAFLAALLIAVRLLRLAVEDGNVWLAVPATLLVAHLMHSQLLAFHEAAHGVFCPNPWLNEAVGICIGISHFGGLSLFRAVHHSHHSHLGTEKDEQLWPFVHPDVPRWQRRLAAFIELSLGIVFDQVLFWRTFFRKDSPIRSVEVRRRIWVEAALMAAFWTVVLTLVAWHQVWGLFFALFLIPAIVAGNMHSMRKYIEHMGLTGSTNQELTRTVIPSTLLGRVLAFSMFNISYHGVHHYYAGMPQSSLPAFVSVLTPSSADRDTSFTSYQEAFFDMLPSLRDPRIGPQWQASDPAHADVSVEWIQKSA